MRVNMVIGNVPSLPDCCACFRAMLIRINTVIGILRVYYI